MCRRDSLVRAASLARPSAGRLTLLAWSVGVALPEGMCRPRWILARLADAWWVDGPDGRLGGISRG